MTTYTPQQIRDRIDECRKDLAHAEGETSTLRTEITGAREELQTLLECEPGDEAKAIRALKAQIQEDAEELETLLADDEEEDEDDEEEEE